MADDEINFEPGGEPVTVTLEPNQLHFLQTLCRVHYKRTVRKLRQGSVKFGEEYDPSHTLTRLAYIKSVYRAINGTQSWAEYDEVA